MEEVLAVDSVFNAKCKKMYISEKEACMHHKYIKILCPSHL
jgi:hypothetical protein